MPDFDTKPIRDKWRARQEEFYLYDIYGAKPIDIPVEPLYDNGTMREVPTVGTDPQTDLKSDKTTDETNNED